jgi:hypothetical protein
MKHAHRARLPAASLAVALLLALSAFAYLGFFARYMADDFCQAAETNKHGFLRTQARWYSNWTGRFASNVSIAAAAAAGPSAPAVLPALVLGLWLAGATWAAYQLWLLSGRRGSTLHPPLLGSLVVFATVNGAHDLAQSLYWQAGLLTHTAPLALMTFNVGALLLALRRRLDGRGHWAASILAAALAFAAGGFSESFALMQVGGFALAAAACYRLGASARARAALAPLVVSLAAALSALLIVALAPGNAMREGYFQPPPGLPRLAGLSLFYSAAFVPYTVYLSPLNSFAAAALPAWIGSRLVSDGRAAELTRGETVWRLALSAAAGMTLITLSVLPAVYGMSQNLPARARIVPQFVFVCVVAYWGYLAGAALSARARAYAGGGRPGLAAAVLVAVVCLLLTAPAAAVLRVGRLIPRARESADTWDRVDGEIRAASGRGEADFVVDALDDVEERFGGVAGGLKLERDPAHGRNVCMAKYYRVRSIRGR